MSHVTVITSCTGEKATRVRNQLTIDDFRNRDRLVQRESELAAYLRPAGEMYTGKQHVHTMQGVRILRRRFGRDAISVRIVSAGYGLVTEERLVAPYEVTFKDIRPRSAAVRWARELEIPRHVRESIRGSDLVIFLLGQDYLDAIAPPVIPDPKQRIVFLAKESLFPRLVQPGVTVVPSGKPQATQWGAGLVSLKGRMFYLFALGLQRSGGGTLEEVHRDPTPSTFERLMRMGRAR